jgi:hypothetical protein
MTSLPGEYLSRLEAIHRQVDGLAASLAAECGEGLVCRRGCCDCCSDDLTVLEIEARLIEARFAGLLREGKPAPRGRCAFLDDQGACRIYAARPYVCRTQGLPLRWLEDGPPPTEHRAICPLNRTAMVELGETPEILPADRCWTLGPFEGRLASLQAEASGRFEPVRLALRSLFKNS